MKILFIGTVLFSKNIFDEIRKSKNTIAGVIGKRNNKFNSDYFDITRYAKRFNINGIYTKDINSKKTISWVRKKKPDLIFCIGWNNLINKEILKIPSNGVIGYHPSDLPKNKGRHPIIWSLALGLNNMGSSFYFMDEKADNGRVISKRILKLTKNSNAYTVYNQLIKIGKKQVRKILLDLKKNKIKSFKQKKTGQNLWRKRNFYDGVIDWRMDAKRIRDLVNALYMPYPGANFIANGKNIILWKCKIVNNNVKNIEPGKILNLKNNKPIVKCGSNALKLEKFEPKLNFKNINYL